jgi:putative endonuclease
MTSGDPGLDAAHALALAAQAKARRARKRASKRAAAGTRQGADAPPRRSPAQRAGDTAEAQALAMLQSAGLAALVCNYRCRAGEIDLIMRDGQVLVFVEVRRRGHADYGGAAASVDAAKQRRIALTAAHFLAHRWPGPQPACRFDVVAFDPNGRADWLRAAFALRI